MDNLLYRRIGGRIRRRRRSLRVLQEDLARKTGLSRGSISNIEAGRQQLYIHHLVAISTALEQDPRDILAPEETASTTTAQRLLKAAREGTTARSDGRTKR